MTKLQELKAAWLDAEIKATAAHREATDCWIGWRAELKKQETAPREPVEDEGNPLV